MAGSLVAKIFVNVCKTQEETHFLGVLFPIRVIVFSSYFVYFYDKLKSLIPFLTLTLTFVVFNIEISMQLFLIRRVRVLILF